jgi:hypothetical protein
MIIVAGTRVAIQNTGGTPVVYSIMTNITNVKIASVDPFDKHIDFALNIFSN